MGTNIREIVIKKDVSFGELKGKVLLVDAYNVLYQFLSSIRQADGTLLKDSHGSTTSHLSGLFSRTSRLMGYGIKLAFVFDGKAPQLKHREIERRAELKEEAEKRYKEAEKEENLEEMKKYASRTSRLTKEMVEEAKELISALGCPIIQAPSEGEAQAAYMVKEGKAFAVVSEDYDSLLYGSPKMIKNLTISGRKKEKGKLSYESITPTMIDLKENLGEWGIGQGQLIALAMLVGTDFNPGGIKGIGQKKALKLVKEYGDGIENLERLFNDLGKEKEEGLSFEWKEVYNVISEMPHTDEFWLVWKGINREKVIDILVKRHDFSMERIESTLSKLEEDKSTREQKGLSEFFG